MCLAYKSITNEDLPPNAIKKCNKQYTFEDFCLLVAEFKYRVSVSIVRSHYDVTVVYYDTTRLRDFCHNRVNNNIRRNCPIDD